MGSDAKIGFAKDALAGERFARPALPIPLVLGFGEVDGISYCQSEMIEGVRSDALTLPQARVLAPATAVALSEIWRTPVPQGLLGYWYISGGEVIGEGRTPVENLRAGLMGNDSRSEIVQRDPTSWRALTKIDNRLQELLGTIGDVKPRLVHGDFGLGNLMVRDRGVSGVIDWSGSTVGDPAYDLAWFRFWENRSWPNSDFSLRVEACLPKEFTDSPQWSERVEAAVLSVATAAVLWHASESRTRVMRESAVRGLQFAGGRELATPGF
jgi:aminoglycoside phosphotransferase (APT) family kinase protein